MLCRFEVRRKLIFRVGQIVELLSTGETSVPAIESALNRNQKVNTEVLRKTDYNRVKTRLKAIGNVGDMTDQLDVAQLVARHLCTRYHSQLICLERNNSNNETVEVVSSSPSWKCCGSSRQLSTSKESKFFDENEIIRKISTFATAVIIQTINDQTMRISFKGKSARKDALATTLVLIVCQAHPDINAISSSSFRQMNEKLSINLTEVLKV